MTRVQQNMNTYEPHVMVSGVHTYPSYLLYDVALAGFNLGLDSDRMGKRTWIQYIYSETDCRLEKPN